MAEQFRVVDIEADDPVSFPDAKDQTRMVTLNHYRALLRRQNNGEQLTDVNIWLPTSKQAPATGNLIEGELANQNKGGLKLAKVKIIAESSGGDAGSPPTQASSPPPQSQSAPPSSSGGGGGNLSREEYWDRKESRDVVAQRRMGRAHSQEMALRALALTKDAGQLPDDPAALMSYVDSHVKPLIDWFDHDVEAAGGS